MDMSNTDEATKCRPQFGPQIVGAFYTFDRTFPTEISKNGSFLAFIRFGTAVAKLSASTWSHANERDGAAVILVPLHRPFLFVPSSVRLGADQLLEFPV